VTSPETLDRAELARFLEILAPIRPALVPCKPGTKRPGVRWAEHPAGFVHPECAGPGVTAIALLTGSRSGDLCVLDVDARAGGFQSLEALEKELGEIPATLTVRSPTGGIHIYFIRPGAETNAGKLAPGVDVRGDGGIVLCPGSVHPRGGIYRIEDVP
jgi:hypothetical protein